MSETDEFSKYRVLWTSFRAGRNQIFKLDLESGDTKNLTRTAQVTNRYPSCAPDGKHMAFTSDRDGTHNLYLMEFASLDARPLTHEKAPVVAGMQSWSADGRWIYFGLFGKGDPLMCRIRPDGSQFEELGPGIDPAISPDGSLLVYARHGPYGHLLFVSEAKGDQVRPLTTEANSFAGTHATWTPDSKTIIYADRVEDALELFSVSPDGSARKQLTAFGQAATSPYVSPDGLWITFRLCREVYWKDPQSSERAYREQIPDFRPVWRARIDGSDPRLCSLMQYHTTIDGSRIPILPL